MLTYHFFVQGNGFYWIEPYPCAEDDDYRDLAMIARDGVARPAAPVVIQEPAKTSHGPIAGLTVVAAVDHRLGSAFR